jgi:hypothetical protein
LVLPEFVEASNVDVDLSSMPNSLERRFLYFFVLSYLLNCVRVGASTIKQIRSKYYLWLQDANVRVGSMSNLFDTHLYEI